MNYPGDYGTPTVGLTTVKLTSNSIVSTINAKFMTIDIKDFLLEHLHDKEQVHEPQTKRPTQYSVAKKQSVIKGNQVRVFTRGY